MSASIKMRSKGPSPFSMRSERSLVGVADPDLDDVREAGPLDVVAGHFGVVLVYFEGDQGSILGQAAREVDGTLRG